MDWRVLGGQGLSCIVFSGRGGGFESDGRGRPLAVKEEHR